MNRKQAIIDRVRRHVMAVLVVALAALLRMVLLPGLGTGSPFITFYPAVIFVALYGGFTAAIFAAMLSAVVATYFWIEPVNQWTIRNPGDELVVALFLGSSVAIAFICRTRQGAVAQAREAEIRAASVDEQARAAEALRASEERLRLLVEHTPAAVAMLDDQLRYIAVSRRWMTDYRLGEESLVGRSHYEVFPELPEQWKRRNERCLAGASEKTGEEAFVRADGRVDYVRREIHPWREPDGRIGGLMIFSEIMTEAKRAHQQLQTRLAALDGAADGVVITNPAGVIEYVNPAFTEITGYTAEEAVGHNPRLLKSGRHEQRFYETLWRTILSGMVWRGELINRRKDGTLYQEEMSITPVMNDAGEILNFIALKRDVTERRRLQEERDESRRRLTGIINSAMDAIITVDETQRIVLFNPAAEQMFRCPASEALNTPLERFIPQRFRHAHSGHVKTFGETGQTARAMAKLGTISGLRADGEEFPIEASISQVVVDGHKLYSVILRDVTERQQTERQLREAKEGAESANRTKDQFLAMLSHELRTPLTPALMLVSSQEKNSDLPEEVRADFATIRHNIELETRIIDDLLDLSRIASGKMRLHMEVVSVGTILRRALAICRPDIDAKGLVLREEFEAAEDVVEADPARLVQVFWNLLKNAVKFTPQGGELWVQCASGGEGRIEVRVKDSGMGIPAEALERIFGAFEQADGQINRQFGGLGLGLAISKAIVELHGGMIAAASEGLHRGAAFTVGLPVTKKVAAVNGAGAAVGGGAAIGGLRLLLVEDHVDTSKTLTRLLRSAGHYVQAAFSIGEAMELLGRERFDLMLSDLGLPDGTGHELMAAAKERFGITGICMSGYGMESDVEKSKAAGFAMHLTKPIAFAQLEVAMRRLLPGGGETKA